MLQLIYPYGANLSCCTVQHDVNQLAKLLETINECSKVKNTMFAGDQVKVSHKTVHCCTRLDLIILTNRSADGTDVNIFRGHFYYDFYTFNNNNSNDVA